MDELMKKLNKLSLPAVILIASIILGGFFYASQVSKQRSIEKQQQIEIEQKQQEQLDKELKEKQAKEEAEQALNACIANAEENYHDRWYKECKLRGKLTSRCIALYEMTFEEYAKKNNVPDDLSTEQLMALPRDERVEASLAPVDKQLKALIDFNKEKDECSCSLPSAIANDIGDYRDGLKDECFKRYPQ